MSERRVLTLLTPDFAFTRRKGGYFRHLNEGQRQNRSQEAARTAGRRGQGPGSSPGAPQLNLELFSQARGPSCPLLLPPALYRGPCPPWGPTEALPERS